MKRTCTECSQPIDELEEGHAAHEPGCAVDPHSEDWTCRCEAVAHLRCCRACAPTTPGPGQADLFGDAA